MAQPSLPSPHKDKNKLTKIFFGQTNGWLWNQLQRIVGWLLKLKPLSNLTSQVNCGSWTPTSKVGVLTTVSYPMSLKLQQLVNPGFPDFALTNLKAVRHTTTTRDPSVLPWKGRTAEVLRVAPCPNPTKVSRHLQAITPQDLTKSGSRRLPLTLKQEKM